MSHIRAQLVVLTAFCVVTVPAIANDTVTPGLDTQFPADESIRLLTVELTVAEDGQDLAEGLALDLGLGFPLWLIPMSSEDGGPPAFGAVPQRATMARAVRAGQRATFTFDTLAVDGSDLLKTNSQLLSDVRVSDIAWIGLCAKGERDWGIAGLNIQINGKPFHSSSEVYARVQDEQALAHVRAQELHVHLNSLRSEAAALQELVQTGLATEEEVQHLQDMEEVLVPQLHELNRIERQLAGSYPWFIDTSFHSPWRNGHLLERLSVTVITAAHTGADTRNFVYYNSGGRKYLLSSPANPLTAQFGPQTFQLDLIGGPATAGDLRGHSLGMLANGLPFGTAPDRCHVQRLLVEVDGRVVYDSDDSEPDRLSLEATRLIPPAHVDHTGGVVRNIPTARETYRWEAGQGMGLDLVNGGAASIPVATDPAWPAPEPGLAYDESWATAGWHDGFPAGFDPFPGEVCYEEDWWVTWEESWYGGTGWGSGYDPWGGGSWGWTPPPSWLDVLAGMLLDHWGIDSVVVIEELEEIDADPFGEPVQIENVRLDASTGEVVWDVVGDDSGVENYLIELIVLRPHSYDPVGPVVYEGLAFASDRSHMIVIADPAVLEAELADNPNSVYVIPSVSPRFAAVDDYGPGQLGAALPYNLIWNTPLHATLPEYEYDGPYMGTPSISYGESFDSRAVWIPATVMTHSGFLISGQQSAMLAMRPAPGDGWLQYTFYGTAPVFVPSDVVMHVGFMNEVSELSDAATFTLSGVLHPSDASPDIPFSAPPVTVGPITEGDAQPMKWVTVPVVPLVPSSIEVTVRVTGGDTDFDHPPVVTGLRVIPAGP